MLSTLRVTALALFGLASLAAVACTETGPQTSGPDAGEELSAKCEEAEMHSDLDWLEAEVFAPGCGRFTACHKGPALSAAGLNLEKGRVADSLINARSTLFPEKMLVVPGEPENSYLMVALGSYDGELGEGGTMPFNNPMLCQEKRDAVERWIESLAD